LILEHYQTRTQIQKGMVVLAVRMVADVTETRNVIPSLEFKICMTIIKQILLLI